jgi:hypothetical protein
MTKTSPAATTKDGASRRRQQRMETRSMSPGTPATKKDMDNDAGNLPSWLPQGCQRRRAAPERRDTSRRTRTTATGTKKKKTGSKVAHHKISLHIRDNGLNTLHLCHTHSFSVNEFQWALFLSSWEDVLSQAAVQVMYSMFLNRHTIHFS